MKKYSCAALAILAIALGSLTLAPAANAVYVHADHTGWTNEPNG